MPTTPSSVPDLLVCVPPSAGAPGAWTVSALSASARRAPDAVAHLGLRTASAACADALALVATAGRHDAASLRQVLAGGSVTVIDPAAAAGLALLWSGARSGDTLTDGAALYLRLARGGLLPDHPRHHQGAGQSLYLAGRTDELRAVLPDLPLLPDEVRHDLTVDLAHPALGGTEAAWRELLAGRFVQSGLAAPTLAAKDSEHLFDRLAAPTTSSARGPLVTVVVPAWRPDEGLLSSVASLAAQTYADLEIIVVDDASGRDYAEIFAQAAALDERVVVVSMDRNGGSYLGRRAAIERSTGAFVTTQDADDWSHPERIERQVAALLKQPGAPASRSLAVRAKDDLTHQWFGYSSLRPNASSLMVRREVFDTAGTYLPMRKSADSEYAERLTALLGPIADLALPLAITRLRAGSLSRGDFTLGWHHPDRIAFRGTYRAWHRRLLARRDRVGGAFTPPTDADLPEVPAPFARGLSTAPVPPDHLDVVVLADLSASVTDREDLLRLISPPDGGGPSVGLWHVERPDHPRVGRREADPTWFDLVSERADLHLVTRTHEAEVRSLVVLDPECLALAAAQPVALRAREVQLAVAARLGLPGPTGLPVDLLGMQDIARDWWGTKPRWVLAPGADRSAVDATFGGWSAQFGEVVLPSTSSR